MTTLESSQQATLSQNLSAGKLRRWQIWAVHVFKFFASLPLAIAVLVTLMGVLAAGTFIESAHGTEAARLLIYQSWWFGLVLLILGLNLAAAAFDRIPWQVRHVGFVLTHAGIIMILIGSWWTQKTMIDGQMSIAENETEFRITLPDPLLYVYSGAQDRTWYVDLKKHPFAWEGNEPVREANDGEELPLNITVLADYPKARMNEEIAAAEKASAGAAAVKVKLKNAFMEQTEWLLEKDPDQSEKQMGPVKLLFSQDWLKDSAAQKTNPTNYLEFQFQDKTVQIPVTPDLKLPAQKSLEDVPYQIKITRVLRNAAVEGKKLIEQPEGPGENAGAGKNPAVEFILTGKGIEEKHTVFAKFPDFPTVHGMKPSAAGVRVFYRLPEAGSTGEVHEVRFIKKDEKLFCQIREGLKVTTQEVEIGKEIQTGWMGGLTVTAQEYLSSASLKRSFTPEEPNSENPAYIPAVKVRVQDKTLWLRQGVREDLEINGHPVILMYGQKRIPAGFKILLKDFRLEKYAGTNNPAAFESDVQLQDELRGVKKDATISMNKPLIYRGYRIYQSGYSQPEGEPEISIFSVGKDPGVPLKYAGAIVMIAGIITMFYTRRFSTTAGKGL